MKSSKVGICERGSNFNNCKSRHDDGENFHRCHLLHSSVFIDIEIIFKRKSVSAAFFEKWKFHVKRETAEHLQTMQFQQIKDERKCQIVFFLLCCDLKGFHFFFFFSQNHLYLFFSPATMPFRLWGSKRSTNEEYLLRLMTFLKSKWTGECLRDRRGEREKLSAFLNTLPVLNDNLQSWFIVP